MGLVAALIVIAGVALGAIAFGLALIGKNKVHEGCPYLRQTVSCPGIDLTALPLRRRARR